MAQTVQLKRSALTGKVPGTGSLNLGELALNTYDGKIFFRRSGSTDTVQEVITTNVTNTGSITITGALTAESIRTTLTASFGSLRVNDTLIVNHGETIMSGSALVTNDLTILGAVNARQFNISVISSSVLFQSGSTRFGNTSDDTHDFTGSVNVTGSLYLNGVAVATGSSAGNAGVFDFNLDPAAGTIGFITDSGSNYIVNATSTSVNIIGGVTPFVTITSQSFSTNTTFTASLQQGYTLVGNSSGTTYAVATSSFGGALPTGVISGSSQLTSSVLATTGSNSFIGNQNISGTIYLTGSIIPSGSFVYDLGSETNSFRDLFLSTGSIRFHNPDGTEQGRITVDAKSGDISLLKTAGLTNEQKATISQGNINPDFLTAISASSLFIQTKIVTAAGATINGINLTAFSSSIASTLLNQNTATSSYEIKGRGIISGSSQLTSSYDTRYVVSGSITQTTWDNIASKPAGIISGSSQLTSSYDIRYSLSGSATSTFIRKVETYTATESQTIFPTTVSVTAGNVDVYINGFKLLTSDFNVTDANTITLTTGSSVGEQVEINLYSAFAGTYLTSTDLTSLNTTTASLNTSVSNLNTATSSYETKGRGIISSSAQLENATITNLTITNLTTVNETASVIFSSGSNRFGDFGDDTHSFTGSVKISGSIATIGSSTATSFSGAIAATNGVVSGSSQVDVMSTTNIARLATTGSNTFTGSQTISGSLLFNGNTTTTIGMNQSTLGTAPALTLKGADSPTGTNNEGGTVSISSGLGTGNGATSHIIFSTAGSAGSGATRQSLTERGRITSAGLFGLGTGTPVALLDVYDGFQSIYKGDSGVNTTGAGIFLSHYTPTRSNLSGAGIFSLRDNGDSNYHGLTFKIHNTATATDAAVTAVSIASTGTSTFNYDTSLQGNNYVNSGKMIQWEGGNYWSLRAVTSATEFQLYRGDTGATPLIMTTGNILRLSSLTGAGSRTVTADASGNLSASSDSSLKQEDTTHKIEGLAEILQLKPRAYKWLSDIKIRGEEATTEIGFFADEVNPIIPSAAPKGNDDLYGFYDRAVIAALVKSIQELKAENDTLKERLTAGGL